jgi:hypothetical protein
LLVGGGATRLEAAPLIDRDVDQHGARLHGAQHFARHELRRCIARHQHGADYEIGITQQPGDGVPSGMDCLHPAPEARR